MARYRLHNMVHVLAFQFFYSCTDINARAAEVTRKTGDVNSVSLQPVITDLVS